MSELDLPTFLKTSRKEQQIQNSISMPEMKLNPRHKPSKPPVFATYSLIQKNGYTFTTVYSSKCVTVFLNQTLCEIDNNSTKKATTTIYLCYHEAAKLVP